MTIFTEKKNLEINYEQLSQNYKEIKKKLQLITQENK